MAHVLMMSHPSGKCLLQISLLSKSSLKFSDCGSELDSDGLEISHLNVKLIDLHLVEVTIFFSFGHQVLNLVVLLETELLHGLSKGLEVFFELDVELAGHSDMLPFLLVIDVLLLVKISQEASLIRLVSFSELSNMSSEVVLLSVESSSVGLLLVSQSSLVQVLLLLEGSCMLIS